MATKALPKYVKAGKHPVRVSVPAGGEAFISANGNFPEEFFKLVLPHEREAYDNGLRDMLLRIKEQEALDKESKVKNDAAMSDNERINRGIELAAQMTPEGRNQFLRTLIIAIDEWTEYGKNLAKIDVDKALNIADSCTQDRTTFQKILESVGKYDPNA